MNIKSETCLKLLKCIIANKTVVAILVAGVMFLSSCASPPTEIMPAYVSPLQYEKYDCSQIGMEMERVSRRLNEVHVAVQQRRNKDSKNMAVGMILFWPSLFFIKGDGPEAVEFARLQGEMQALEKIAIRKKCDQTILPEIPEFRKDSSVFTDGDSNIYHNHDCTKLNIEKDIVEFKSVQEAQNSGGKPCKLCNPKEMTINQKRLKKGR
tara:strand:- start:823 stop:1449 length:627 start_codon:yes stop_codon:yes gene_type:complete